MADDQRNMNPTTKKKSCLGRVMYLVLGIAILLIGSMAFLSWSGGMTPPSLGVVNGKLAELPDKPNCVSTQTNDDSKRMEPLPMSKAGDSYDLGKTMETLKTILSQKGSNSIVDESEVYLHTTFQSRIFRFTDDVEFLINSDEGVVHFRSASRSGHSDMGVNRKRMLEISTQYLQTVQP